MSKYFQTFYCKVSYKRLFTEAIAVVLFFSALGGCSKPRLRKTDLESYLEKQCQQKYGLDVITKKNDSQLGILCKCENVFEDKQKKIIINRAILCTSNAFVKYRSEILFLHLFIRDENSGVQNRYIWNRKDLEKNKLGIISPKEFRNRALFSAENNLDLLGRKRIEQFFQILPSHTLKDLLKINPQITLKIFSRDFFHHLLETSMKENTRYEVLSVKEKAVSDSRMLFFYRIRHSFDKKNSFDKSSFKYKSGSTINFIFGIESAGYLDIRISEIYTFNNDESFNTADVPEEIKQFGDPEAWKDKDFYLAGTELAGFIARLIAQRLQITLNLQAEEDKNAPAIEHIEGDFIDSQGEKTFQLVFQTKDSSPRIEYDKISDLTIKLSREVCEIYNFTDFDKAELMFPSQGVFKTFEKKELGIIL